MATDDDDSVFTTPSVSSDEMVWDSDEDDGYWAALDDMALASLGAGSPPRRLKSRIKSSLTRTTAEMKTRLSSLREKLKQARYRKLRDKLGFTAGITNFGKCAPNECRVQSEE